MPTGIYPRTEFHKQKIKASWTPQHRELNRKLMIKRHKAGLLPHPRGRFNGKSLVKHHIYGRNHGQLMEVTRALHNTIHMEAYFYVLERYGKAGINDYFHWLKSKGHDVKITDLLKENEG